MNKYTEFKSICKEIDHYPVESELIYKYSFTRDDVKLFNVEKLKDNDYVKLSLLSQEGDPLLYWKDERISLTFSDSQDLIRNSVMNQFSDYRNSEIINGFIFSEIESSLSIEGVSSTRTQIERLYKTEYEDLTDRNDIIIKNMLLGYEFVTCQ